MVDLPGDGSNTDAPGAPADPYSLWPGVVVEAAQAVERPVYVGHSTGGMYLLRRIAGGAHFPWIERPDAVRAAFADLAELAGSR